MSKRPLSAPHRQPGRDRNQDLEGLSADELAVVAAGCDALIALLWQKAQMDHCEIDRLLERQNAALRLLGKARRTKCHAAPEAGTPDALDALPGIPAGD